MQSGLRSTAASRYLALLLSLVALFACRRADAADPPLSAEIPHWRAVLYARPIKDNDPVAHVRVSHANRVLVDADLPRAASDRSPRIVRFAQGALPGHTIVWVDVVYSGKYDSTTTVLYDFGDPPGKPKVTVHDWGLASHELRTIAGKAVYVSTNEDFYGLFDAREFSVVPLQVLALRSGRFVDVTQDYPLLLEAEVKAYLADIPTPTTCASPEQLGAYLADMLAFGKLDAGLRFVTSHSRAPGYETFFQIETSILHAEKKLASNVSLAPIPGIPRCIDPHDSPPSPQPN